MLWLAILIEMIVMTIAVLTEQVKVFLITLIFYILTMFILRLLWERRNEGD